jgi:hypothetical protein
MPGFDDNVMYASNVDFRGVSPIVGQMTTDGQLLIGSTASPHIKVGSLIAGAGISVANTSGSIMISATGAGFSWHVVTSATNPNSLVAENAYIAKGAGSVSFLLPATAAIGDRFIIVGYSNLWALHQNAMQQIFLGSSATTAGIGGSITATNAKDIIEIVCVTTNTEFTIVNSVGNLVFV